MGRLLVDLFNHHISHLAVYFKMEAFMADSSKKATDREGSRRTEASKKLGRRVRFFRNAKGLTQEKFSELCGISPRYISELERGEANVTVNILEQVAATLGIKLKDLFDNDHETELGTLMKEIAELLETANDGQLKTIYRVLAAVVK